MYNPVYHEYFFAKISDFYFILMMSMLNYTFRVAIKRTKGLKKSQLVNFQSILLYFFKR